MTKPRPRFPAPAGFVRNGTRGKDPAPKFPGGQKFSQGGMPTGFVDYNPEQVAKGFIPTSIAVACTKCRIACTVDMPKDADHRILDKMLNGRIVKAFCLTCRQVTEVRPFTAKELKEEGLHLVRRYCDNYQELVVNPSLFDAPGKMIQDVLQATEDYMKDLRTKTGDKPPMVQNTPPDDKPKIIIP